MYKNTKTGFRVEKDFLLEGDRLGLIKEVDSSRYLERNDRGMWSEESDLYGDAFSVIFKREFIEKVYEEMPHLEKFFSKVIRGHCNIFYLCAMSLSEACYIPKHFDEDLIDGYNSPLGKSINIPDYVNLPRPFCTSIYYPDIPDSMKGGSLKIFGTPSSDVEIQPEQNMMIEFGEYEHEVSKIENSTGDRRLSLVFLQNKYLEFQRNFFPDYLFSKG